jgi:PPOX class probable F420-dependent enzyme
MEPAERDDFLREARVCRVATVGVDGSPHNSALWYVWDGSALWLNTIVRSQRWVNLDRDPRVSVLVDGGELFSELRGVELIGMVEKVGEAPRTTEPNARLELIEDLYGKKYRDGYFLPDGKHAWIRLAPAKIVSWDFRKIHSSRD